MLNVIHFTDRVSYIAILQLQYADLNRPGCKEYLDLAQFTSHTVDYPKTGVPVDFKSLPPPPQSERPDFLSSEGSDRRLTDHFYRSQKILGILFHSVLINDYTADCHHRRIQPSDSLKIWACLLQAKVDLGVPSDDLVEVLEEMKHLLVSRSLLRSVVCYLLHKHTHYRNTWTRIYRRKSLSVVRLWHTGLIIISKEKRSFL